MSERAEVVVVGGGVVGCCTALFLALPGAGRVAVVERDPSYERASTTRSAAAVRQQFHLGVNVAMSRFGFDFYEGLDRHLPPGVPSDICLVRRGYLVLTTHDALPRLEAAHRAQVDNGASVELLDAEALRTRFPWLQGDDVAAATFGTDGEGWFDPVRALRAVRAGAEAAGVTFVHGEVAGIDVTGGRVSAVRLRDGRAVACGAVVNAAGANAAAVARLAGGDLPIESRKRTVFLFRPRERVEGMPNLVDPTVEGRGLYLRPYDDVYMAVTAPPPERDPHTGDVEPDWYLFDDVIRAAVARRIRGFDDVELVRAWAGHYEMNTFDQNAVIGEDLEVGRLYHVCGFSGHGVMHAPAAGRGIAELLTGGSYTTIDLSPFAPDRIRDGRRLDDVQPSEARVEEAGI
jgi:FAD-dependent oxidoreductase domain-containing protein 1